ncbi:DUF669 domain-containing protein [Enterocloster citroniae]|uniref:DUF669 domain-containing protein n=1 Tax=Enterocloster citroniae TaxID=358743 RepID=UPI00349EAC74
MKVNYNNTEPKKIAPGQYEVTVVAFDVKTSTAGNQMINLDYEIRKDIQQESQGARIRYDGFTFTDNGSWRISAIAMAAGVPDGYDFPTPEWFGKVMMHRSFLATVEDRTYNGKTFPNVTRFDPSRQPAAQPELPVDIGGGFIQDNVQDEGLPFN